MVVLRYQMQSADEAGEHRHPQIVYREIGLNPVHAWPESIADCWILHCTEENVKGVALPSFIEVLPRPAVSFIATPGAPGQRVYSFADVVATVESPYGTFTFGAKEPEDR